MALIWSVAFVGATASAQTWVRDTMRDPTAVTAAVATPAQNDRGPAGLQGTLSAEVGLEYTDNARLTTDGEDALALVLGLKVGLDMPLTEQNQFHLQVAGTRRIYLDGPDGLHSYQSIAPGSDLGFDVFVGRAKIRTFVSASLQEDPIESVVISQTDRFGRLNIDAGAQLDWDMNRVVLQGMVLYGWQDQTAGGNGLDAKRRAVSLQPYFPLGKGGGWGVSLSASDLDYDLAQQNDSHSESVGVFLQHLISRQMRFMAEAGVQRSSFDRDGSINDNEDFSGAYGSLRFDHQVRRALRYTVIAAQEVQDGIGTNFYEIRSIRVAPQLALWRQSHLDCMWLWERIHESGSFGESATRQTLQARLQRPLSSRLEASLEWRWVDKRSDIAARSYTRNRIAIFVQYSL